MTEERAPFPLKRLRDMTTATGVYLMKDDEGTVLYVGKAKNLRTRIGQYFVPGRDGRMMVPFLTSKVREVETIVTLSEKEALLLEDTLIKKHQPRYNILLKDDKTFISLAVNHKHRWPRVRIVRAVAEREEGGGEHLLFGPYASAFAARTVLDLIHRMFKLRQCSDRELTSRTRPCLLFAIKRCLAPCMHLCTASEYADETAKTIAFLRGENKEVLAMLREEMRRASDALEFERAGSIRDTILQVEEVTHRTQTVVTTNKGDYDVIGAYGKEGHYMIAKLLFRQGRLTGMEPFPSGEIASTKEELLVGFVMQHYGKKGIGELPNAILLPEITEHEELEVALREKTRCEVSLTRATTQEGKRLTLLADTNAKHLFKQTTDRMIRADRELTMLEELCGLTRYPLIIECFDISHISGSDTVACMVAFRNGERDKKRTLLFHVRNVAHSDDYAALEEVLLRRFKRAKKEEALPDLAIIDGGKGQLKRATEVFEQLDIASVDLISLAKERGRHDRGLTCEKIHTPDRKDPICLPTRSPILFLLQRIRDEAHGTAMAFHKKTRLKRLMKSTLENVPGIGPKKKRALLQRFKSVERVFSASDEELLSVPGITKKHLTDLRSFGPDIF
ncbi:MAG: excinuclease ABC subunit UvrC [Simkaniaceae bacterium]|nr:excinuclease ABC subunit UvrC [Simkaniaceae bacterium]